MSHVPHQLSADFPELAEKISSAKASDPHFARLLDDYNALNAKVHLAETNVEPMDEGAEAALRKQRMQLKDTLYKMLTATA